MKRLISVFLAVVIICSAVPALAYNDIPNTELAGKINMLSSIGYFSPAEKFNPGSSLTRAAFCVVAVRLKDLSFDEYVYRNYTKYGDVRAGYWGIGWINAASSLKLMSGKPDGNFAPNDSITYAEVITVLMKILGYTDADVGSNWPNSYIYKAQSIGLTDGVNVSSSNKAYISRGELAAMMYNMLFISPNGSNDSYISSIGITEKKTILLSGDILMPDGKSRGVLTSDGYLAANVTLDAELSGRRVLLLSDKDKKVVYASGEMLASAKITCESSTAAAVIDSSGKSYSVPGKTPVYSSYSEDYETFSDLWVDLIPGETLTIYYTSGGAVDYIYRSNSMTSGDNIAIFPQSGKLSDLFGAGAANASVYKNNNLCSVSDLMPLDVLIYDKFSNTVIACDTKITGVYQKGLPNVSNPTEIYLMDKKFIVTDYARDNMAGIKLGNSITLLLTPDGKVAGAVAGSNYTDNIALVTAQASEGGAVTLKFPSGYTFNVTPDSNKWYIGNLVKVSGAVNGNATVTPYTLQNPPGALNLSAMTVGNAKLAGYCSFYEAAVAGGCMTEIKKSDVPKTVASSKILNVMYNQSGAVTAIVFSPVVYDCFTYGKVTLVSETVYDQLGGSSVERRVSAGDLTLSVGSSNSEAYGYYGGIAGTISPLGRLTLADSVKCNVYNITRSDFQGAVSVKVGGKEIPIANGVDVYVPELGYSLDIQAARGYSANFTVYTDPADNKVRIIVAA